MKLISEESLKELLIVGALLFAGRLERKEDAQVVIDNPNFQEILDTIYKNK